MVLAWLSFAVSVLAALAAVLSIPTLQAQLSGLGPRFSAWIKLWSSRFVLAFSFISPILIAIYYFLFYPCAWYTVNNLKLEAVRFFEQEQYSSAEDIGQQLCTCGASAEGWDVQAKSEYAVNEFRTAINFWNRSAAADPVHSDAKFANIAAALIWLNDYKGAIDKYRVLYSKTPSDTLRYGLGRALVFHGDYKEASDLLNGLKMDDGGSAGQSQVFKGLADLGLSRTESDSTRKNKLIDDANKHICSAIALEPQWKDWLYQKNSVVGHLESVRFLLDSLPNIGC